MGTNGDHSHSHGEHYHGEPSRTLESESFPETAVVYKLNPKCSKQSHSESLNYWFHEFDELQQINQIFHSGAGPSTSHSEIESLDVDQSAIEFLDPEFQGFSKSIRESESVLFVPSSLRLETSAWRDLGENDVTVNWICVDPKQSCEEGIRTVILSDWITKISRDIPAGRSSGRVPGIFHLTNEAIKRLETESNNTDSLDEILSKILEPETMKIRPGFLRGKKWHRV